jgi:hypothetical protein
MIFVSITIIDLIIYFRDDYYEKISNPLYREALE